MNAIREPAVAGLFYPGDRGALETSLAALLGKAGEPDGPPPKALILPHAGFDYSGPTAAAGYARLIRWRDRYARVVLVGPSHRVAFAGLAASSARAFRTPLGDVPVDAEAIAALRLPTLDAPHSQEHSLEVHLPFLQTVLGDFRLVPLVAGDASHADVAGILDRLWGGAETLIVVSSDLSHYLDYDSARARDRRTCEAIERFDDESIDHDDACGATPVGGLLIAARRRELGVERLDLRNSGDTAGPRDRVVGYGAWAFAEGNQPARSRAAAHRRR